ncbi:MAG TPA: hypothetical protein VGB20_05330 [bacterium]
MDFRLLALLAGVLLVAGVSAWLAAAALEERGLIAKIATAVLMGAGILLLALHPYAVVPERPKVAIRFSPVPPSPEAEASAGAAAGAVWYRLEIENMSRDTPIAAVDLFMQAPGAVAGWKLLSSARAFGLSLIDADVRRASLRPDGTLLQNPPNHLELLVDRIAPGGVVLAAIEVEPDPLLAETGFLEFRYRYPGWGGGVNLETGVHPIVARPDGFALDSSTRLDAAPPYTMVFRPDERQDDPEGPRDP